MPRPERYLIVALCLAFLAIWLWVEVVGALPGDGALWRYFAAHALPDWTRTLCDFVSALAEPVIAAVTIAAAAASVAWRRGPAAATVVVAASAVVALVAGLKLLIGATSPWTELSGSHADNFPSGHVAYATAVFGAIAWLARGRGDRDVATLAVAVVALMGPARISVRAHLLSDVLAGYAVGAAWLLVVVAVSGRRGR